VTATVEAINPRYAMYAAAHGKTPDEMLAHDEVAWPGGKMCGFILWIQLRWREWDKENNWPSNEPHDEHRQHEFDEWLWRKIMKFRVIAL
jgi:hypothetical protein